MISGTPIRKRITRVFGPDDLQRIRDALTQLNLNKYEALALRGAIEAIENLMQCRDELDVFRHTFEINPDSKLLHPNPDQRRRLYDLTKAYFDSYYSTMSNVSSVIARFSSVFEGKTFNAVAPFVKWIELKSRDAENGHESVAELEQARLFRALLSHPQQFPPADWSTSAISGYRELPYVVVFGPESRNKSIPPGATRGSAIVESRGVDADWSFDAPDEVSVTNCVANVFANCMVDIFSAKLPDSPFRKPASQRMTAAVLVFGIPLEEPAAGPPSPPVKLEEALPNGLLVNPEFVVRFS